MKLISRISQIIYSKTEEFQLNGINIEAPLYIAGGCFFDVLRDCGVPDDAAEMARRAFICMKQTPPCNLSSRFYLIASQISSCSSGESIGELENN